jgi:hypothetical protein
MKLNVSRLLDIIYQEPDDRAKIEDTIKKNTQKMGKYRLDHREQISERKRKYYLDHREQISERKRKYRLDHREQISEWQRKYYLDHKGLTKEEVSELLEETVK